MKIIKQITIALIISLVSSVVCAADWYVRPAGGNYGKENGTSYADAWDGLKNVVWGGAGVSAGDTLYVCGTHTGQKLIVGASGTNDSMRITIRGDYSGDSGIIDADSSQTTAITITTYDYLTVQNIKVTGATSYNIYMDSSSANYVTFDTVESYSGEMGGYLKGTGLVVQNSKFYNNTQYGCIIKESTNALVSASEFHNNGTAGKNHDQLFIGNGSINFLVVDCIAHSSNTGNGAGFDSSHSPTEGHIQGTYRRCISYNNLGDGFCSSGGDKTKDQITYEYCLAYNNSRTNWRIYETITAYLYNCTLGDGPTSGYGAIVLWGTTGSRDVTIKNCIVSGKYTYVYRLNENYTNLTAQNNVYQAGTIAFAKIDNDSKIVNFTLWKSRGYDTNGSLEQDPQFVSVVEGNENFRLQSSSVALDAGVFIPSLHSTIDLQHNPAPYDGRIPEIGAYELSGAHLISPQNLRIIPKN